MKAWLKGGLIGLLMGIVLFVLSMIEPLNFLGYIFYPLNSIGMQLLLMGKANVVLGWLNLFFLFVITLVYLFVIGAFIGWIIGKIKSHA